MQRTAHAEGGTVLVVDDDPDVRGVLTDAFKSEGFRVMTAANGMQALHRARDVAPDVVILDLNMPMMSGDAFLYAWRVGAETHGVPVVAISAAYPSLRPEDLGVDAFFPKPFEIDLLVRTSRICWRIGHGPPRRVPRTGRRRSTPRCGTCRRS